MSSMLKEWIGSKPAARIRHFVGPAERFIESSSFGFDQFLDLFRRETFEIRPEDLL